MRITWTSGAWDQSPLQFSGSIWTWTAAGVLSAPVVATSTDLRFLTHVTLYCDSGTVYLTDQEHPDFPQFLQQLTASARMTTALPDPETGVPLARRVTLSFSNELRQPTTPTISYLLTLADVNGVRAHVARWDTQLARYIAEFDGIVQAPDLNHTTSSLVVAEDQDALNSNIPTRLISDEFPSADFSTMRNASNAPVRVAFGVWPKVELALCVKTFIVCQFVIDTDGGTVNKYLYKRDTTIPNVLIPEGARLVYNVRWFGPSAGVKMSLYNGTDLLHGTSATDQNGVSCHPNADIPDAEDKFTRLDIPLPSPYWNTTVTHYLIGYERVTAGGSANAWISDAAIVDKYGAVLVTIIGETVTNDFSTVFLENPEAGIDNTAIVAKFAGWEWGAIRAPAITSRALFFNGSGSWTIANPDQMVAKTFTAIVPVFCGFGASIMHVFGREYTSGDGWQIGISTAGKAACRVYTGGGAEQALNSTDTVGDAASWHWIALAVDDDAKQMKVIIDEGTADTFTYTGAITTGGGAFTLADDLFGRTPFTGYIGAPVIYDRFLSDAEIRRHYNATKTGQELGLVGYWPLEEGAGDTTVDLGPRSNAGALFGHVWDTGPTLIPNIVNEVYEDGAVIPRELWQPALWGGDLLMVRQFTAPRNSTGRLPRLQVDIISREFDYSPAQVAKFTYSDTAHMMGQLAYAESFALVESQYRGLIPPARSSIGYRMDGGLATQVRARDVLPEMLLRARIYKESDEQARIALDIPNYDLTFDGTDDEINLGDQFTFSGTTAFTIQCILNPTDIDEAVTCRIFSKEFTDGSGAQGWAMQIEPVTGCVQFVRKRNGTLHTVTSDTAATPGKWTRVSATYDGATLKMIVNEVEEDSLASTQAIVAGSNNLMIGAQSGSTNRYKGRLDEIRIWNQAYTATQIATPSAEQYQRRECRSLPAALLFYLQCNEINRTGYVYDLVGQDWYATSGGCTHTTGGAFWDDPIDPRGQTIALGDGDFGSTQWQNARLQRHAELDISDYVNRLELSGGENPGFEGETTYDASTFRQTSGRGITKARVFRFVRDWATLDDLCSYLIQSLKAARQFIEVDAHHSARLTTLGHHPPFYAPNMKLDGARWLVAGIDVADTIYRLSLRGWDLDAYTFAAGQASAPPQLAGLTDYSQTLPDMPTGLTVPLDTYVIADNGNVTVRATVQATVGDTPNITGIAFLKLDGSSVILGTRTETAEPGDTVAVKFDNLEQGQTVYFTAYAVARTNKPGFQDGVRATPVSYLVPSAPGAPGTPTGLAASTTPGAVILTWTNPSNKNLGAIEIHRSLVDSFSDDTTRIDTITRVAGSQSVLSSYIDTSGDYDQVYYYSVRAVNTNGEKGSFATSVSAAAPRVGIDDRVTTTIIGPTSRTIFADTSQGPTTVLTGNVTVMPGIYPQSWTINVSGATPIPQGYMGTYSWRPDLNLFAWILTNVNSPTWNAFTVLEYV